MRCEKSYNQGRQDLEDEILKAKPLSAKIQDVKTEISQFYNIPWEIITQKRRQRENYLFARQTFCFICKTLALAPDRIIAEQAGYVERTSVRAAYHLVRDLMDVQPEIKSQILHILNRLK